MILKEIEKRITLVQQFYYFAKSEYRQWPLATGPARAELSPIDWQQFYIFNFLIEQNYINSIQKAQ